MSLLHGPFEIQIGIFRECCFLLNNSYFGRVLFFTNFGDYRQKRGRPKIFQDLPEYLFTMV